MSQTDRKCEAIPKKCLRHHSYDESADEPVPVIDHEDVQVEAEIPAEENESMEATEQDDAAASPAFEKE